MTKASTPSLAARGPSEHVVRTQIVEAANECFSRYGYGKTTVSDLAREIGFSKAYIYRFFESKQAIGEAICGDRLRQILEEASVAIELGGSATDRLRQMFKAVTLRSVALFFDDRKIFEIAALAATEQWTPTQLYSEALQEMLQDIIKDGREKGEFERKTPIDELCRSIYYAMTPFIDPVQLERNLHLLPEAQSEVMSLVLRSLAP